MIFHAHGAIVAETGKARQSCTPRANLAVQNIDRLDVGRPRVQVQAEKLRRINPSLHQVALQQRIEDVPRGLLNCDLIVSCLDSKVACQHVNEIAWRLNTPFIDCGVLGSQNLVRVNAYIPAQDSPCLECSWGHDKYSILEQEYLCSAAGGAPYLRDLLQDVDVVRVDLVERKVSYPHRYRLEA